MCPRFEKPALSERGFGIDFSEFLFERLPVEHYPVPAPLAAEADVRPDSGNFPRKRTAGMLLFQRHDIADMYLDSHGFTALFGIG